MMASAISVSCPVCNRQPQERCAQIYTAGGWSGQGRPHEARKVKANR